MFLGGFMICLSEMTVCAGSVCVEGEMESLERLPSKCENNLTAA